MRTKPLIVALSLMCAGVNSQNIFVGQGGIKPKASKQQGKKWYEKEIEAYDKKQQQRKTVTQRQRTTVKKQSTSNQTMIVQPNKISRSTNVKDKDDILNMCYNAVFMVCSKSGNSSTSGFFLNSNGLALSSSVMFHDTDMPVILVPGSNKYYEVDRIYAVDPTKGYALFHVSTSNTPFIRIASIKCAVGDVVYGIEANTKAKANIIYEGQVLASVYQNSTTCMEIRSDDMHEGNGGPILNRQGEVVGVRLSYPDGRCVAAGIDILSYLLSK